MEMNTRRGLVGKIAAIRAVAAGPRKTLRSPHSAHRRLTQVRGKVL
jgi:hypothetical protein